MFACHIGCVAADFSKLTAYVAHRNDFLALVSNIEFENGRFKLASNNEILL